SGLYKENKITKGYILVSLDVVSLFTNIPNKLILKTINEDWRKLRKSIKVLKNILIKLIQFYFKSSYFQFNGTIYQQINSASIGNPAGPVYVDDVVTAIPKDRMDQTLQNFNNVNNKIQFTMEVENNRALPFLDMNIIRNEDVFIVTSWYVKPTSSGKCTNYNSNHPISQKIGVIKGLLFRALTLRSKKFHIENKKRIELILKNIITQLFVKFKLDRDQKKVK
ncbi:hypothetical protein M0804_013550, partial [Polistes exclamans]